jgi:SAM domain (Sterile alpha motif)
MKGAHTGTGNFQVASLRLKCARLERDLTEYRNTTPRLARPAHLASLQQQQHRSPTPVSSPDDTSPTSRKGGGPPLLLSDDETATETANEMDTSMVSLSGRSTRGLRKILGKIKRSNSGGFECERRPVGGSSQGGVASVVADGNGNDAVFKRGGTRATASGRLGWSNQNSNSGGGGVFRSNNNSAAALTSAASFNRKRFSDWSVDMLCSWLETIGLGQYTSEVQRYIGTGADLARLGGADLDAKLGIRNPLHRKKLILAMQAKIDPNRPDPAGELDCAWVIRWLDDIGLPQYKETFLECRVDGRLLNLLTVDDLCYLRVSSLLHHCSIRRGIQILRQRRFDGEFLKRRADHSGEGGGEEEGGVSCVDWSNHRVMEWLRQVPVPVISVVDPDPHGSETLCRIHNSRFRIRIRVRT